MKNKFLIATLLLMLSGCSSVVESDFALSLTLRAEENSEDSNSQTETLELNGTRGEYTWTYEGYGTNGDFDPEKKESFTLTEEQVESLKLYLTAHSLAQDLVEEKSREEPGQSVEMTLNLEIDGEKTSIHIAGMSSVYGEDTGKSNLENFASVEAAQDLISTVGDLAGLYHD